MKLRELLEHLQGWPEDSEVTFGALTFNRVKRRGPNLIDVELWPPVGHDPNREDPYYVMVQDGQPPDKPD